MKLIVFGASGRTGRELTQQALARGHEVTALVRKPAEFDVQHEKLHVVAGDITDAQQVQQSIRGHDAAASTLGPHTLLRRVLELTAGLKNIVRGLEREGVRRFVYTSALGVGDSNADQNAVFRFVIRPVLLGRDYADHEQNEQVIRASNLEWVLARPARLVDGPRTADYQVAVRLPATFPFGRISRADVADFVLQQLEQPTYVHQAPGLLAYRSFWG